MGYDCRRIEDVRHLNVPVHVAYRGLQHPAQQFGPGEERPLQKWRLSSICIISSLGCPHQKTMADFMPRHKVGHFILVVFHLPRCRSPPPIHLSKSPKIQMNGGLSNDRNYPHKHRTPICRFNYSWPSRLVPRTFFQLQRPFREASLPAPPPGA